jgi:hypothetical protein
MGDKKDKMAKLIITENGEVKIEGDFNRNALITILRKELKYQEELERIKIAEKLKQEIEDLREKENIR